MIKVFLADDHEMFRHGLKTMLENSKDFKVVGQASDGEEIIEKIKSIKCDCLILDLSMPNVDGLQVLQLMHDIFPKVKCVVLTMHKDPEHFKRAMASGAQGYVLKDCAFNELSLAIKSVLRGKKYVSSAIKELIDQQFNASIDDGDAPSLEILTERERQILSFIAQGMANKNIASKLKISIRTVETHRNRLNHKLGVKNTASLVKYAITKGLLS